MNQAVIYDVGPGLVALAILCAYPLLGAAALSVGEAWAELTPGWKPARYAIVWTLCTTALVLPVFLFLGFPGELASSHTNVAWAGIALSALTISAALGYARRWWPSSMETLSFRALATRLFAIHLAVLVVVGAADLLILGMIFLGNIH